ncbi:aspartate aminotransferase family protein [Nocardioides nanhaiensis]|uniref:Lysine decarboxylase DesA n=1 Tax=Nocardioides nanhaiensis TaxID=1476871 RepID=A0ABP8W7N7_9ACTN
MLPTASPSPASPPPPSGSTPQEQLFGPGAAEAYAAAMRDAVDHLVGVLRERTGPATGLPRATAEARVAALDLDRPLDDAREALAELDRVYLRDTVWFDDPGYLAHLNCPVLVPALAAEVFVSAVNSSLDTFDQGVGAAAIERALIAWTAQRAGLGPHADGVFTSGGTQSNLQGLLLAREQARAAGTPVHRLRVLASEQAHFSVQKAARLLGLGEDAVVAVPTDARRRMDPAALATRLEACSTLGLVPMAVVATAGTTDFGAIDPLPEVARLCREHGAWLHVDAAYGGGLLVSPTRRHLLAGVEHADSLTVDYHKTWFQPVSSSALLVRERRHLRHVTWHADYLNPAPEEAGEPELAEQVDKSLQTTRRFDALKLWLTLRSLGPDAVGHMVDDVVDLATEVATALERHPHVELAAEPQLSTIVLRYRPAGLSPARASALTDRIRAEAYASGRTMVAATTVDGERWLKLTLLNPATTADQVLAAVDHLVALGERLTAREAA